MNCPKCNTANLPNTQFCQRCGFSLLVISTPQSKMGILGKLGVIALFLGMAYFWYQGRKIEQESKSLNSTSEISSTDSKPLLKVISKNLVQSSPDHYRIIGELQNVGSKKITGASVYIKIYDKAKNLIEVETYAVDDFVIQPGATTSFTAVINRHDNYGNIKVTVKNADGEIETIGNLN